MGVKRRIILPILLGILLTVTGCSDQNGKTKTSKRVNNEVQFQIVPAGNQKIGQIRGIGYPGNDDALYIATNDGLKYHQNSKWHETTANKHNYMSFQAIDGGYLASGHPKKGTDLKDPLGIVISKDKGKSLNKIAFYGKGNFHFLSGSFFGNGLYVIVEQPIDGLEPGVYFSKSNNGVNWVKSKLAGFSSDSLGMIAVHSKNGNIIAMATKTGIYYSENYSNTMNAVTGPDMVTSLTFSGDAIIYSDVEDEKILLKKVDPKTGEQNNIAFPFLDYDNPVTYITVNPKNENQIAFSTYKNDLYESLDGGKSWTSLLTEGRIEQE